MNAVISDTALFAEVTAACADATVDRADAMVEFALPRTDPATDRADWAALSSEEADAKVEAAVFLATKRGLRVDGGAPEAKAWLYAADAELDAEVALVT